MITRVEGGLTYTQTFRHALSGSQCNAFDAENGFMSVTVSGQTTQFIYNGDGNLVKKINPNGSKTIYVGGIYEGLDRLDPAVDKASGGSVTRTVTYYPVAGAMRINSTLYYILKDHLGSASVVTDASGNPSTSFHFAQGRYSRRAKHHAFQSLKRSASVVIRSRIITARMPRPSSAIPVTPMMTTSERSFKAL